MPEEMYMQQYAAEILNSDTDEQLLKLAIVGTWCSMLIKGR